MTHRSNGWNNELLSETRLQIRGSAGGINSETSDGKCHDDYTYSVKITGT